MCINGVLQFGLGWMLGVWVENMLTREVGGSDGVVRGLEAGFFTWLSRCWEGGGE